jgi:hypothetical protein
VAEMGDILYRAKPYLTLAFIMGILGSCVTIQDRMLQSQERAIVEVVGRVNTQFITMQFWHKIDNENISKRAYSKLMEEARKKYQGNIDVVNITADGNFNPYTLSPLPFILGLWGNFQTVNASGDVVLYSEAIFSVIEQERLTDAVKDLSAEMTEKLPNNSTIAILSVYSPNGNNSEYIIGELEYNLVNSDKFRIVDRRRLDQIRLEQNFQLSGDVSDASAVSIGNMLGANIVIVGEITGSAQNQHLILRALDVRTAQIITMVRKEL